MNLKEAIEINARMTDSTFLQSKADGFLEGYEQGSEAQRKKMQPALEALQKIHDNLGEVDTVAVEKALRQVQEGVGE